MIFFKPVECATQETLGADPTLCKMNTFRHRTNVSSNILLIKFQILRNVFISRMLLEGRKSPAIKNLVSK